MNRLYLFYVNLLLKDLNILNITIIPPDNKSIHHLIIKVISCHKVLMDKKVGHKITILINLLK